MSQCGLITCEPEKRCRKPECLQCRMYDKHPRYRKRKCGKAAEAPNVAALLAKAAQAPAEAATVVHRAPTLMEKAKSAALAGRRFLLAGLPIAPEAVRAVRKRACEGDPHTPACEFFDNGTCKHCGCNLMFKQAMATEHCPIGKW